MIKNATRKGILGFVLSVLFISGCATTGAQTRTGAGWFSDFKEVYAVTSSAQATKRGVACTKNILGVAFGDASIEAAKKNGGISTVSTVDNEITNILFVYGKNCVIVHGS